MGHPKVVYEKGFHKNLEKLTRSGKRNVVLKARAAMAEAATDGVIKGIERTHHGESRLPKAEKYDLGDGYRLVVQLVEGKTNVRAFLFVGKHDDAERWLDNHRGYKWVKTDKDGSLVFTQVSTARPSQPQHIVPDPAVPLGMMDSALLVDISEEQWRAMALPDEAQEIAASVSRAQYEQDDMAVMQAIETASDYDTASFLCDLLTHAQRGEVDALRQRVLVRLGVARVAQESEVADAMLDDRNSERFISWSETLLPPENASWEEWMLFLQPEQREFSARDFNGPARLRGVSGSGKTCVAVHRARQLAIKYRQPVLLVTLTLSMRMLLDRLVRSLCGAEQSLIHTRTINSLAKDVIESCHPRSLKWFRFASNDRTKAIEREVFNYLQSLPAFMESSLSRMRDADLAVWLREELEYVRGRLVPADFDKYADSKLFKRVGRSIKLSEADRCLVLKCLRFWEAKLEGLHLRDHLGVDAAARTAIASSDGSQCAYRCVIVDEVQDLTQIQLELVSRLVSPEGEAVANIPNGLFLVGDGAQAVYKRGFSFSSAGINIANRSFALRQNYRNTREILEAAYLIIAQHKYADVDEDNVTKPIEPDLATRHGDRPILVKCSSGEGSQEVDLIVREVRSYMECGVEPSQICIIGCNGAYRQAAFEALHGHGVPACEIRDGREHSVEAVRISTIESSKGHEFKLVIVCGLVDGVIPGVGGASLEDMVRECSRLYVAMTRARDHLLLTYTVSQFDKPSRLLSYVQSRCDEFSFNGEDLVPLEA